MNFFHTGYSARGQVVIFAAGRWAWDGREPVNDFLFAAGFAKFA